MDDHRRNIALATVAVLAVAAAPHAAEAHLYGAYGAGFADGAAHPIGGIDHLLAMVAVGLWAAQIGGRALVALPAAFLAFMALGGVAGAGAPHLVELAVAGSVLALGAIVALAARPAIAAGMAVVGAFALFHGLAHGAELSQAMNPWAYALGFLIATAALHALGVGLGRVAASRAAESLRWGGGAIAAAGAVLVFVA